LRIKKKKKKKKTRDGLGGFSAVRVLKKNAGHEEKAYVEALKSALVWADN